MHHIAYNYAFKKLFHAFDYDCLSMSPSYTNQSAYLYNKIQGLWLSNDSYLMFTLFMKLEKILGRLKKMTSQPS